MDKNKYQKRVDDLNGMAARTVTPEITSLLTGAAGDITELLKATPPGCSCHTVETDNYNYLDYAEGCLHHSALFVLQRRLKENYAKMERALKDEARMRLIVSALSGKADVGDASDAVDCAIQIADLAVAKLMPKAS